MHIIMIFMVRGNNFLNIIYLCILVFIKKIKLRNTYLKTLLWYLLYEAYANNTPNPGPSEKNTCVAASTQT